MGSVTIDWSTIIVALVAASAAGTRLIAWMRANRGFVRVVCDVLEHLAGLDDPGAKRVKSGVKARTALAGGQVLAVAEAAAATAEKRNGGPGSATRRKTKVSKAAKIAGEVARWIPLLGMFR